MVKLKITMVLLICSFSIFAVTFKPALPLEAVLAISVVGFFVCLFLTQQERPSRFQARRTSLFSHILLLFAVVLSYITGTRRLPLGIRLGACHPL